MKNCKNCGAPLRGNVCEYCGSEEEQNTRCDYSEYAEIRRTILEAQIAANLNKMNENIRKKTEEANALKKKRWWNRRADNG